MGELEADQDHQAAVDERERNLKEKADEFSRAEQPVVQALAEVGVDVQSVWDLVNSSTDHPQAVEVLEQHLKDDSYPDRVREGSEIVEEHGESRLILLHGLKQLRSTSPAAMEALEGFVDDEVLGKTASRSWGDSPYQSARPPVVTGAV